LISTGTPKAKAFSWGDPDAERRKLGHGKGLVLDTHWGIIKTPVPHFFIEVRKLGYIGGTPFKLKDNTEGSSRNLYECKRENSKIKI